MRVLMKDIWFEYLWNASLDVNICCASQTAVNETSKVSMVVWLSEKKTTTKKNYSQLTAQLESIHEAFDVFIVFFLLFFFWAKCSHVEHRQTGGRGRGSVLCSICCQSRMLDHHHIFVGGLHVELHGSESIKISRSTEPDNVSLSRLVMWICNRGGYINHVVNDHRWWIGESWRNIYVGCKKSFPEEVLRAPWKHW